MAMDAYEMAQAIDRNRGKLTSTEQFPASCDPSLPFVSGATSCVEVPEWLALGCTRPDCRRSRFAASSGPRTPGHCPRRSRPLRLSSPVMVATPVNGRPTAPEATETAEGADRASRYQLRSDRKRRIKDEADPPTEQIASSSTSEPPRTPSSSRRSIDDGQTSVERKQRKRATVSPYFSPRKAPPTLDNGNTHHPHLPPHLAIHPSFVHTPEQFGLVQELLAHDSWALLLATCLLNKTRGQAARPMTFEVLSRWPTPAELAKGQRDPRCRETFCRSDAQVLLFTSARSRRNGARKSLATARAIPTEGQTSSAILPTIRRLTPCSGRPSTLR